MLRRQLARVSSVIAVAALAATTVTPAHAATPLPSGVYSDPVADVRANEFDTAGPGFTPPPLPDSRALPGSVDILSIEVARTEAVTYVRVNITDLFGYSKATDRRAYQTVEIQAGPHVGWLLWGQRPGAPVAGATCNPFPSGPSYSLPVTWSTTQEYILFRFDNRCEVDDQNVLTGVQVDTTWLAQKLVNNRPSTDVRRQFYDGARAAAPQ